MVKDNRIAVCPRCASMFMVKYGEYEGQQKWHCTECGKTTVLPALLTKDILSLIYQKKNGGWGVR